MKCSPTQLYKICFPPHFRRLSVVCFAKLKKTSLQGGCVTQVIPKLRVSTPGIEIRHCLPDADFNWTISKFIYVKEWRLTVGRCTNGLVGLCQSQRAAHTLCHGVRPSLSLTTTSLFCLTQQLCIGQGSFPFFFQPHTIWQEAAHQANKTKCNWRKC